MGIIKNLILSLCPLYFPLYVKIKLFFVLFFAGLLKSKVIASKEKRMECFGGSQVQYR